MVVDGLYFIDLENLGEPVSIQGFPVPASLTVRHLLKQNSIKKLTAKNFLIFQHNSAGLAELCVIGWCLDRHFFNLDFLFEFYFVRAKIALLLTNYESELLLAF